MEDSRIIKLYFDRNESAIKETASKYGAFCRYLSGNILENKEDVEECVNDTYLSAWNHIPPTNPANLKVWLGRVVRNISLNLWNKNHAQKRYQGMELILDELAECVSEDTSGNVPKSESAEDTVINSMTSKELGSIISDFLRNQPENDRNLFVKRYWYGESLKNLSDDMKENVSVVSGRLFRMRQKLQKELVRRGVNL